MITVHKICPLIFVTKVVTKMGLPGCILKMHPNANFPKKNKDAVLFGFEEKRTKDASFLKKDVHI